MSKTRKALLALLGLVVLKMPLDMLLAAMLPDASVSPVVNCLTGALVSVLLLGVPAWLRSISSASSLRSSPFFTMALDWRRPARLKDLVAEVSITQRSAPSRLRMRVWGVSPRLKSA